MLHSAELCELPDGLFSGLGEKWMLITAGSADCCNTMTAGWGGIGTVWRFPAAICFVRPQRYTREFLDREDYFTLSFFEEEFRPQLSLCGSKSGRDTDKVKECGFTVKTAGCGAPYFEEAEHVLVCRKRYVQQMDPKQMPADVKERWYEDEGDHIVYLGEIIDYLKK